MIVASFYAPREDRWGCDYDKLLSYVEASCNRVGLRHVVISDSIRPEPLATAKFDLPENLMLALLDGQKQFLASTSEPVLLIGADCLVLDEFELQSPYNMAITVSDTFSDCRFNSGAIWCRSGKVCAPIWEEAIKLEPKGWGDDQRVLYSSINKSELLISEVDCREFNWAPNSIEDGIKSAVVHFRGKRKAFMPAWAERWLGIKL